MPLDEILLHGKFKPWKLQNKLLLQFFLQNFFEIIFKTSIFFDKLLNTKYLE